MFRHTILAATLALSAGSIAAAQDRESRTVRFNTAALGNADDRRELEAEIRLAARDICHTPGLRGARAMRQQRECETEAVNAAMRRVDIRLARLRDERPNPAAGVG
jgi:UrcA family protein|tara:strand:- start:448 stop:765 length:318 start_codon:yes stop_codon:yes gene_type:complete